MPNAKEFWSAVQILLHFNTRHRNILDDVNCSNLIAKKLLSHNIVIMGSRKSNSIEKQNISLTRLGVEAIFKALTICTK